MEMFGQIKDNYSPNYLASQILVISVGVDHFLIAIRRGRGLVNVCHQ
jgi:hypothetical protein